MNSYLLRLKNLYLENSVCLLCLLLFFILLNTLIFAQSTSNGLPDFIIPDGVGVNTHFTTGGTVDHDMIAYDGFKFIRQDFFWSLIETTVRGQYNWGPYDTLMQELDQRGIRCLATLNLNDTLYAPTTRTAPTDSANIAAYASFCAAAAERYKSSHPVWEFWNEPNGKNTWKPAENAAQYAKLALAAAKAIRAVDSNATIIAPAMAGIHLDYLDTLFQAGLLNYIDGVSVHPYRDGPPPSLPETVGPQIKQIQNLIAQYAPPGKKIFVVSGEWGYSTCSLTTGVSLQTQADYIVRMNLFNLYSGVPLTIWYDWKNDGTDLTQIGQNRGVVTSTLAIKPSYIALKTLTLELSGFSITGRYNTPSSSDVVLILKDSLGNTKLAAWTQGSQHNATIPLSAVPFPDSVKKVWWINGKPDSGFVNVQSGSFTIPLNNTPAYFSITPPVSLPVFNVPTPSVPVPNSPGNSSTQIIRETNFIWNPSSSIYPIKYHLQVAIESTSNPDGTFLNQNVVVDTMLSNTSIQLTAPLDSNTTYFWKVSANNVGGASAFSTVYSFKTGSVINLPSIPVNLSPVQFASNVAREPVINWQKSLYADEYHVQVASDYQIYTKGDSAGMFYAQNVVFDATLPDTAVHVFPMLDSLSTYFWHVGSLNAAGAGGFSNTWKFTTGSSIDAVEKTDDVPKKFFLNQNYPNPFNPSTTIAYGIPKSGLVTLNVFNILGQRVATVVNKQQYAGSYAVNFNANGLPSGVYIYRLQCNGAIQTKKLLLMK